MNIWVLRWGIVAGIIMVTIGVWLLPYTDGQTSSPYLSVSFLDVGQGDAIFIETPDGIQMLIDGGPDGTVIRELAKVMKPWDRTIDVVVATHADKDHIAGLIDVLDRFEVGLIIMTTNAHDTNVANVYRRMVAQEGAEIALTQAGDVWQLGASTTVYVYSPAGDSRDWESNASSIVTQIVYGDTKLLFTGDAPLSIEEFMVQQYGERLQSDVLKLGHHGSRTSTSERFAQTVVPKFAVVSAGRANRYGHPHQEPITNIQQVGALVLATAVQGTIRVFSDGNEIWAR
jgi:competence protein ComEC